MKHLPYSLLVAAPLLLLSSPAHAAGIQSWRFDAAQNRLEFTTDGDVQPKAQLIADPTRLVIDLPGIVLGRPAFTESVGGTIRSVRIGQFDRGTTRVVIELAPGYTIDPDRVTFRGITARQWTVQLPTPMPMPIAATPPSTPPSTPDNSTVVPTTPTPPPVGTTIDPRPPVPSTLPPLFKPATIEAIELTGGGTQLLIRASQTLRYSTGWDRATGAYRLSISSAKLASNVKGPQFNSSSPIRSLRLRQEDANTVVILIQPAAGIRIAEPNLLGQTLALQLQSSRSAVAPTAPIATIPVPAAPRPTYPVPPRPTAPSPINPRVPNG
ncbi:AMIN domain-containing protein, partial [Leptolyngbya sp. FACHB-36]|uniref:AMIN domain-containing protein n=1 Tax=Leptolyngbya sp. FACHB-36 TaxID=2692808 RepID=UPI001680669D|nr:AMIN domain-containing protein [Leptolyngbya sp. FACHB-36]